MHDAEFHVKKISTFSDCKFGFRLVRWGLGLHTRIFFEDSSYSINKPKYDVLSYETKYSYCQKNS